MNSSQVGSFPPHVLIFPVPVLGHVNSMLKLAELLCLANVDITFFISEFCHRSLLKHTTVISRLEQYPGFRFQSITDGLADDHPRAGEQAMEIFPAIRDVTAPLFKQMMVEKNLFASQTRRHVSCIIPDGSMSFAGDFALENGIPLIYFRTSSAVSFWANFHIPQLIEAREICGGVGMDEMIKTIPGMEGILRYRDLPSFCRASDVNDSKLQFVKTKARQTTRAQALIFNTLEDLEGPIVHHIRKHIPRVFTIGPNHYLLKQRLAQNKAQNSNLSASFWAEDRSCLDWLNSQPSKSVLYVSFGSITTVSKEQLLEFWHGLVNSGQKFLWVIRPDSIVGEDRKNEIPVEPDERTKAGSYMVEWAPQEEVLNHDAVGGFLTHSGWNSTLESILAGVPMICWPYFADQMINSRFVSEVWKIGLDIKDTCDRKIIEKVVRELMEERAGEFLERAANMANLARKAVSEVGSSVSNLNSLIDYIKTLII